MAYELLADEIDGRLHVAVVRKKTLDNLYIDPASGGASWGSLYWGRIAKIDKRLDCAFVDLGNGQQGFLPAKHVHRPGADSSEQRSGIAELVAPGQMLLVQVKSEAKRETAQEHQKLPRLTTKLYVFGQHLVYCPLSAQVAVSSRVENEKILKTAASLKGSGGWILHSSAERASEDDINYESRSLLAEWQVIEDVREASEDKPRLLRAGPSALYRALFDYGAGMFSHIHVGNKAILEHMVKWCERHQPNLARSKRLRLFRPSTPGEKLFETHDLYSELSVLSDPVVPLNSGGSIIIEQTQAVTLIDVNQGGAASIGAINQAAALEVARQTRIRNLSGAILVDFINMHKRAERASLLETLSDAFNEDYALAQVHGFTRLGIVEVTRKRRGGTLAETLAR